MLNAVVAAIAAVLLLFSCSKPSQAQDLRTGPDWWLRKIAESSTAIYHGLCEIKALELDDVPCVIFSDALAGHGWLVLFTGRDDQPTVIVQAFTDKRPPAVVWCRRDFCPKGVI